MIMFFFFILGILVILFLYSFRDCIVFVFIETFIFFEIKNVKKVSIRFDKCLSYFI